MMADSICLVELVEKAVDHGGDYRLEALFCSTEMCRKDPLNSPDANTFPIDFLAYRHDAMEGNVVVQLAEPNEEVFPTCLDTIDLPGILPTPPLDYRQLLCTTINFTARDPW
jgi:hypothetical protein